MNRETEIAGAAQIRPIMDSAIALLKAATRVTALAAKPEGDAALRDLLAAAVAYGTEARNVGAVADEVGYSFGATHWPDAEAARHTAHHEAGHAVAARRLDFLVESIEVALTRVSGEGFAGGVRLFAPVNPTPTEAEAMAVQCLAGFCAEARYDPRHIRGGYDDDLSEARRVLAAAGFKESKLIEAEARATALVRVDWKLIRRVASELLRQRGQMSAGELEKLIAADRFNRRRRSA